MRLAVGFMVLVFMAVAWPAHAQQKAVGIFQATEVKRLVIQTLPMSNQFVASPQRTGDIMQLITSLDTPVIENDPMFYDGAIAWGKSVDRFCQQYRIDTRWRNSVGLSLDDRNPRARLVLNLWVIKIPIVAFHHADPFFSALSPRDN